MVAWAVFYGVRQWYPTSQFARTPTYGKAPAPPRTAKPTTALGAELYRTSCASCHQANGQGVPKTFPPLAGNPVVIDRDPEEHIKIVLFGEKEHGRGGDKFPAQMPAWADQLSDEEVAAVVNHERTSWGNSAPTVTTAQVARIRAGAPR